MQTQARHLGAIVSAFAVLCFSGWAMADPPSRVARLGFMIGTVSFSPAGEDDWVQAAINRPLTTGDRLWVDGRARAEMQVGGAVVRMNADTGLTILNLDDEITQLELTQGTLNVRVRRLQSGQLFEINTPNLAFTVRQPGEYRVHVDADGGATLITVRKGRGEAYGEDASYVIDSRQTYRFTGTRLSNYEFVDAPRLDEFDTWATGRDRSYDNSTSARYVSQDVIGYQDLDANGTWRNDATYGNVWFPNRVASGWAPYRDGHWAWIDPWGWTWVDDAPWGFAVSHYGRWANLRGNWGWVPGPVRSRAYYAPALVAFVGGNNFQLSVSSGSNGVAWFPLAPREVYRPSYATSRGYFENINRSNTVVNVTVINNTYNNTNINNVVYANRQVAGAVIAVPTNAFVQSQSVSRAAVRVTPEMNAAAPVAFLAPVAPTRQSVRGAANQGSKPPGRAFQRPVVARTVPPAVRAGFEAQQQQLTARPGRPLDDAERRQLKPAAAMQAPVVKVVAPTQIAAPTAPPPGVAPAGKGDDRRGKSDDRKAQQAAPVAAPTLPAAPAAQTSPQPGQPNVGQPSPPQAAPVAPVASPPEQRGKSEQRGKGESRAQPAPTAPPVVPQPAAPAVASKVAPIAPAAAPPERGRPEQRGKDDRRAPPAQPAATAPAPPAVFPTPPPAPVAQPREQREKPEPRGRNEPRGQPEPVAPPQRAEQRAEPQPVPRAAPSTAQPPAVTQSPPPPAQSRAARAPQAATPAPAAPPAAPKADPRDQDAKPAQGKQRDKKKEGDDDRDEEKRKRKD